MITIDFETQSKANLLQCGADVYAEDESTRIICIAYAINDEAVKCLWPEGYINAGTVWKAGDTPLALPDDLRRALGQMPIEAHNVAFERAIWKHICVDQWGWPEIPGNQWRDTQAVACYYALPAPLDTLAQVLGFPGKDKEGTRLISRYSKLHLKTAKAEIPKEDHLKFCDYCAMDVALEREVSKFLGDLPPRELEIFQLDQEINQRGVYIDWKGATAAKNIVKRREKELTNRFATLFAGWAPTQTGKILSYLQERGHDIENVQKDTLEKLLPSLEGSAKLLVEIRLEISKASVRKLDKMLLQSNTHDGRARNQLRYHGASTGRWTASGFQILNLKKNEESRDPEQLVRDIMKGDPAWLDMLYGDAIEAVGSASRHWVMADGGNEFTVADYASIEAIILAHQAGEWWKVEAFRDREPIYEISGCIVNEMNPELAKDPDFKEKYPGVRFQGKTAELAFGYQGGIGAWRNFDKSGEYTDEAIAEIRDTWRNNHPRIVDFWKDMEHAAMMCVRKGERTPEGDRNITPVGMAHFQIVEDWLTLILPDDKRLWYWKPEIRLTMPGWHRPDEDELCAQDLCSCTPRESLTYMSYKNGGWRRISTYGGKLTENYIQAVARQILVAAMLRIQKRWPNSLVLSVYDEVVCEYPKGEIDPKEFESLLIESPGKWADKIPVSAEVWQGKRYKK